jgi:hypothetical protein
MEFFWKTLLFYKKIKSEYKALNFNFYIWKTLIKNYKKDERKVNFIIILVKTYNKHKKTKILRNYKKEKRSAKEENEQGDSLKSKIEKYENIAKMIDNYDHKIAGEKQNSDSTNKQENVAKLPKQNIKKEQKNEEKQTDQNPNNRNNSNFNKKHRKTNEEIEKEKAQRKVVRHQIYKKLNKRTPKGQPVMKYQMQHIFNKIKDKISKGII